MQRMTFPTQLFVDGAFRTAPWAICVFITDGKIDELDEVKSYCRDYARQIAAGKRSFCKLVRNGGSRGPHSERERPCWSSAQASPDLQRVTC